MMATVPKHVRFGQNASTEIDSNTFTSSEASFLSTDISTSVSNTGAERIRSFSIEELPSQGHQQEPLLPPKTSIEPVCPMEETCHNIQSRYSDSVLFNQSNQKDADSTKAEKNGPKKFWNTMKKTLYLDDSAKALENDWIILEMEESQLEVLRNAIQSLSKAISLAKNSSTSVRNTKSILKRCDILTDRSFTHLEQSQMMFANCENEMTTLRDYMKKLQDNLHCAPSGNPGTIATRSEKGTDKRNLRRVEWAISRMQQSLQTLVMEMRDNVEEMDDIITECSKLMVKCITLFHRRGQSADLSGTGIAAGAAGIVAGVLVGVAGFVAAPVTGGLSIPISLAGKGLLVSGVAALTPSTIMLNRQQSQLKGFIKLVECLKSRLVIMTQKRVDMAIALAACEEAELNMTQLCAFIQDSIELGYPPAESNWSFLETTKEKLIEMEAVLAAFLVSPTIYHCCREENALYQYLTPEDEE
uniref:Transmembrane protein putative n=1 Tax=Albugo laibachii Nc14 TaxID=890382 RepID=F0W2R7_9STRA|nr:transmembrane protein putative [Albugo laibachii Nc14]|eukprot:CCA15353.1 transmembrane protein putative [Albugo laibachii Nc14]